MGIEVSRPEIYSAALYIRLSREDENQGPSESVTNQRALLEQFANEQQLPVHDIYIDDGWSGTSFDRPAFRRMIADIEAKKVNMVITKDLSRLGRDYIMTGHYMERYFPEHGVRYISLLDGVDTGVESSANDITPFRAIMNDMYAKDISKKIKSVKRDKQRRGQFIGGKPVYGYKMHPTEKNKIVIDENAAGTVRRIFSMALEGTSCRSIAARLNAENVPSPAAYAGLKKGAGSQWSSERISEMLQNETYIGNMVQGRRARISYKSKKCARRRKVDWIVVNGTHEPIIDDKTFNLAAKLISGRRSTRSRTYDFLLKGLIFCHECGCPLGVINRKNAAGDDVLYFVCRTYQRFTKAQICTSHTVKERMVTDAVLARVGETLEDVGRAALLSAAEEIVSHAQEKADSAEYAKNAEKEIKRLNIRLDRAYADKLDGVIEDVDFSRIYAGIKARRELLGKSAEADKSQPPSAEDMVDDFLRQAPTSRALLASLVKRVELTADKRLIIYYTFRENKNIM